MSDHINQDSDFLIEKIKQRPLNRKKLLRRTLITALMAVLFGTVACVTFLFLEPVISNRLYPEEETEIIEFPEKIIEEEILPEDMYVDEAQMEAETIDPETIAADEARINEIVEKRLQEDKAGLEDYLSVHYSILDIAREARKAVVTVTGVTSDVDWFNDAYESQGQTTGTLVWDNGKDYLILVNMNAISAYETIRVTFVDGKQYPAEVMRQNYATGLAVLSVSKEAMSEETLRAAKIIELGNSSVISTLGTPIIAIGRVIGNSDSILYGFVTSTDNAIRVVDASYKLITTDINGSRNAAGLLINMQGQAVGIIDNSYYAEDMPYVVSAIGTSELHQLIKTMSDNMEKPYAGIYGMNVTVEAYEVQGVPLGAYVTETEMESPAMEAGIQSGDVIVKIEEEDITTFNEFVEILLTYQPEDSVLLTVMRLGTEGYRSMEIEMVLGHSE